MTYQQILSISKAFHLLQLHYWVWLTLEIHFKRFWSCHLCVFACQCEMQSMLDVGNLGIPKSEPQDTSYSVMRMMFFAQNFSKHYRTGLLQTAYEFFFIAHYFRIATSNGGLSNSIWCFVSSCCLPLPSESFIHIFPQTPSPIILLHRILLHLCSYHDYDSNSHATW